jgi:hypothetical protein
MGHTFKVHTKSATPPLKETAKRKHQAAPILKRYPVNRWAARLTGVMSTSSQTAFDVAGVSRDG